MKLRVSLFVFILIIFSSFANAAKRVWCYQKNSGSVTYDYKGCDFAVSVTPVKSKRRKGVLKVWRYRLNMPRYFNPSKCIVKSRVTMDCDDYKLY